MRKGNMLLILTLCAALGCGLMGGVLFTFSDFVMTALSHQPPASAVRTMQSINIDILNPLFFLLFFGTPAAALAVAALAMLRSTNQARPFLFAGAVLYLAGTLGVTVAYNIPLNNRLALLHPATDAAALYWPTYFSEWMWWNHVRSIASVSATVCFLLAIRYVESPGGHTKTTARRCV